MTIEEQKQILNLIEKINEIDIESVYARHFNKETSIDEIKFDGLPISQIISKLKELLGNLKAGILSEGGFLSPPQNLSGYLNAILGFLTNEKTFQPNHMFQYIKAIDKYRKDNFLIGLNAPQKPIEENIDKSFDQLKLIEAHLSEYSKNAQSLINSLEKEKSDLSKFKENKKSELQEIENKLQTVRNQTAEVVNHLNLSTQHSQQILNLLDVSKKQTEEAKLSIQKTTSEIQTSSNEFKKLNTDLQNKIKILEAQEKSFEEKLEFVESKKSFFEERNSYLEELIGREAGASLFETFKQRKDELQGPVSSWKWIVIITATLTVVYVILLFTNCFGLFGGIPTSFGWERVLVNTLKASPAFIFLYYTIAQYNKERNFQEEYAFKSSAALTVKAYVDLINDNDKKDELIMKSLDNIYSSPIYRKQPREKDSKGVTKDALDLAKGAIETVKNTVK